MWRLIVIACAGAVAHGWARAAEKAPASLVAQRPNVILILADDLGYGDVSCNGAARIQTPHIDRLAREGRRFTSGYCSASTCTPTRYSLLTGEYAFRRRGTGIAAPNAPCVIPAGIPTLPAMLAQAGYRTAVIGKWHLGLGEQGTGPDWNGRLAPGPLELGFQDAFILPTTNDRVPQVFVMGHHVKNLDPADPLWVGMQKPAPDHPTGLEQREQLKMDWSHGHNDTIHNGISRIGFYTGGQSARFRDEDLADIWVAESMRFIESCASADQKRPFFLYLASHDIHVPRIAHKRFQGATSLGPRGDCITQLDWTVGQVMKAVERLGVAEETLLVFCSDNGPVLDDGYRDDAVEKLGDHAPAGPFRDGKYSVYEGGTRTPFIAWWPGHIAPGVSGEIVCTIDLAASLARLTGQTIASGSFPDSVDVLPALLGTGEARGRTWLVQQDDGTSGRFGYREGKWKLVRLPPRKNPRYASDAFGPLESCDALYDLDADPGETTDVRDRFPDEAARLSRDLARLTQP
jgi:arylsulfatase A